MVMFKWKCFLDHNYSCHGNFVPLKILVRDQFFQKKSFHPERIFLKKRAGAENFVPVYTLLKIDCKKLYDARRGRSAQNEAQNNCLIANPTIDDNSIQCKVVWKHKCISS